MLRLKQPYAGTLIRSFRSVKKMSAAELSNKMGYTTTHLSRLEGGFGGNGKRITENMAKLIEPMLSKDANKPPLMEETLALIYANGLSQIERQWLLRTLLRMEEHEYTYYDEAGNFNPRVTKQKVV